MTNARLEELRTRFQENPRRYFAPFANELRKAGDAAQAIAICRSHLAGQPGHVSGHIVLGQALYEAGDSGEASAVFTAALELDPENLIALRTMGEIAQVSGDFDSARHWYERLLDADPRNAEVVQLLRDIPSGSTAAPVSSFAPPEPEPTAAEPIAPDAAVPPAASHDDAPPPPSGFHTTFTGVAVAYQPRDRWEPPAETSEAPAANTGPLAEWEPERNEPDAASPPPEPTPEPTAEVNLEAEPAAADISVSAAEVHLEIESFDLAPEMEDIGSVLPADTSEFSLPPEPGEAESVAAAAERPDTVDIELNLGIRDGALEGQEPGLASTAQSEPERDETSAGESVLEPPRALFAEHGFEGEVERSESWITPSAAYSDLEAAPEDWFFEEATSEAAPEIPGAASGEVPEASRDSWFEEGPAETTGTDEFAREEDWMPDFAGVAGVGVAPAAEHELPPQHREESTPEVATMEVHAEEPHHVDVEAIDLVANEAIVVDHPASTADLAIGAAVHEVTTDSGIESPAYESTEAGAAASTVTPDELVPAAAAEYADPTRGHTPSFNAAIPVAAPEPFVTETLAELYLQQGFRDEALAIYRQLAERDPSDQSLRIRISAIEAGAASDVMQAADAPVVPRPSVRAFFSRLAHRVPVGHTAVPEGGAAPEVPFAAAASALANLFAASRPPAADEGAAARLSSAFTDPGGRPSRAADRELSLDHLFRDVPAGGQGASGVKLDEFYATSTPATQPDAPTPSGEAGPAPEREGTDIRQFTAWLEGLRKK